MLPLGTEEHPQRGRAVERRGSRDRRGQGDELARLLTEAFREERRVGDRRR